MEQRKPSILACNILYFLAAFFLVALSYLLELIFAKGAEGFTLEFLARVILTEFGVVLLPAYIYLVLKKKPVAEVVRFNKLKASQFWIIIALAIVGYVVIIFFNYIWIWLLTSLGGELVPPAIPAIKSWWDVLLGMLTIGGTAAIAEEFLFRGVILRGYERFGPKTAIVVSGILFGILHMQTQSVLATCFLGILIGYLVYRTDSIFAGMIYHFVNNSIAVLLSYGATWAVKMSEQMGGAAAPADMSQIPMAARLVALGVLGFFAVGALGLFIGLIILLNHVSQKKKNAEELQEVETKAPVSAWHFLPLGLGLIVVAGMYVLDALHMFGKV